MFRSRAMPLFAVALLWAGTAAAVPSPANSTVPACVVLCPLGDMPFTVVVRDLAFNPIAGSLVVLDFSQCPGAYLCTSVPTDPYTLDPTARTLSAVTDAAGSVTFPARVGGVGPVGSVRVFADGVLLASRALASPDQDGNGVVLTVLIPDQLVLIPKFGTSDPTGDLNCDGYVDIADEQVLGRHGSQFCGGYVEPAHRSTWSQLKAHYR